MAALIRMLSRFYNATEYLPVFEHDVLHLGHVGRLFWRSRVSLLVSSLVVVTAIYLVTLQMPPRYASRSTVYAATAARSSNVLGNLGAMANALGYGLPSGGDQPLALDDLLDSRRLFEALAETPFAGELDAAPRPLRDHWNPETEISLQQRTEQTVARLRKAVKVHATLESNLVAVEITADTPELAQALNQRLVELADAYYRETRNEELRGKVAFLAASVADLQLDLSKAEDRLTEFLTTNARYEQSPLQLQEYGRLFRNIELQQRIYVEMEAQLLSARLELSRLPTSVRFLNLPTLPLEPSYPERLKLVLLGLLVCLGFNAVVVICVNQATGITV